jgi:hypothetical protein
VGFCPDKSPRWKSPMSSGSLILPLTVETETSQRFSLKEKVRWSRLILVGLNFLGLRGLRFLFEDSATRAMARITRLAWSPYLSLMVR